jgi:hypothetical protein
MAPETVFPMAADQWFNQNWVLAAATLLAGLVGVLVLLRQLRALNQKNKFDLLQFAANRMSQRFGYASVATKHSLWTRMLEGLWPKSDNDGEWSSVYGRERYYALKRRFRDTVATLPEDTRGCRVARVAIVCGQSEPARQSDFHSIRQFVNAVNDVAEMIEEGLADVGTFLAKYHLSLIREVYIAEPYIYYYNLYSKSGRWGMRVLRLGEMARQYNDISPIHRQPVFFTDDLGFGCIYGAPGGRLLRLRKCVWFARNLLSLYPSLTSRSKGQQSRFLEKARHELEHLAPGWSLTQSARNP